MGRKLKIFLSITFCAIIYCGYYFGIPRIVNLPKRIGLIEQAIYNQTGMIVKISSPNLKMGYIPSATISFDEFLILNDDSSKALFAKNASCNIRFLPLIFKKINIQDLKLGELEVNLEFDGNFKLGKYELKEMPKSDFEFNHISADIKNYKINLNDTLKSQLIKLDGDFLTIKDFTNNKHIELATSLKVTAGKKLSSINLDTDLKLPIQNINKNHINLSGEIKNLDLSDFSSYINKLSNNKIKATQGVINVTAKTTQTHSKQNDIDILATINGLGIINEDPKLSIIANDEIEIHNNFETIPTGINIKSLKVKGTDINFLLSGEVTKLNSKMPYLNLKVGVPKSRAERIVDILPPSHDIMPDMDFVILKQAGFWGDASAYLEIKGRADIANVYGNVLVENAYMVKPIPNSEKATIKLAFKGDKFDLDVRVPTSPTQTVWVKGPIELYGDKSVELHITSTKTVDLKTAQIVLNPLHRVLHFDLGPVPIMDIKGNGGINLKVVGTRENPHAWGEFFFKDAIVSFLDVHDLEIVNGSGKLDFDNQNTFFKSDTAILNKQPISIAGTCSLYGELNFDVVSQNQNLEKLVHSIKISPMLKDIAQMLEKIDNVAGNANVKLNLHGKVQDLNDIVFNKNIFAKGEIQMLSNTLKIKDLPVIISKVAGMINFDNTNVNLDLISNINNSKLQINGKLNNDECDIKTSSDKFNAKDVLDALSLDVPFKNDFSTINTSFTAKYSGNINDIDYDKINMKGKIHSNKGAKSAIITSNSDFELKNSKFKLSNLKGSIKDSAYNLDLNISKLFNDNRSINGYGQIKNFDLKLLNNDAIQKFLPKDMKDIEFLDGKINISARAKNSNINVYSEFDDTKFEYLPQDTKVNLKSGNVLLQNTTLSLNKINADIDGMPVFTEGKIYNVLNNPNLNLYLNFKPNQEFFDKTFNTKSIYPIKVKGDVILTSKISGNLSNINMKSIANINEASSLYYMGATIGDSVNPVKIAVDSNYSTNKIKINNLQYDKIIMSQNNKPFVNTQLNASGMINILPNQIIGFNNLHIKTKNPTDAKIFNIIFGKPFMKQGVFNSDIILNGTSLYPKIIGTLDITSIDIPFFDSTIRDINFNFKPDKIYTSTKGTVLTNDVILNAVVKNRLKPPYVVEDLKVKLADLDVNKIIDTINDLEVDSVRNISISQETTPLDISQLIVKNSEVSADKIQVRNINATNFLASMKLTENHVFDVNKFQFNLAEGLVSGNLKFNIQDKSSNLNIKLKNANADVMSEALFDLKGQIYGSINGGFNLACNFNTDCFKTLSGQGDFEITDGRMPKLGSLEYLLKAGNLIRGGITGLSINGLIDLITPLKTGDFDRIFGDVKINNGLADNHVYSSGKDLNMYMSGKYDIPTSIADMKLFGSISKHITSVSGKVKNASLNTLFNTIPGISDNKEKLLLQDDISRIPNIKNADIFRIFTVDVNGDINGNNYIQSFRWVK